MKCFKSSKVRVDIEFRSYYAPRYIYETPSNPSTKLFNCGKIKEIDAKNKNVNHT
jgi:hypothetical protein